MIKFPKCAEFFLWCQTDYEGTTCALLDHSRIVSHLSLSPEQICIFLSVCILREGAQWLSVTSPLDHI